MKNFLMVLMIPLFFQGCTSTSDAKRIPFEYGQLRAIEKDWEYTQALKHGKTIYLSGSVSMDTDGHLIGEGDMATQLKHALDDVKKSLAIYGANQSNIVKETIFTTDIDALIAASKIRAEFYKGYRFPPSSWIGVKQLGLKGSIVEVEVIAELD